jgi:hypothetical protein
VTLTRRWFSDITVETVETRRVIVIVIDGHVTAVDELADEAS